jgi:hypothetical protein
MAECGLDRFRMGINGRICEQNNKLLASVRGGRLFKDLRNSTFVAKVGHLIFRKTLASFATLYVHRTIYSLMIRGRRIKNCKACRWKRACSNLGYYPSICIEVLKTTTKDTHSGESVSQLKFESCALRI